jgi:hypothetical protein
VDLNLQSILVVVPLYAEAATEPVVGCLLRGICFRWCLVVMEVLVADAQVGDDSPISVSIVAEAIAVEAHALADEGCLWLVVALLALLFLVRSAAA